MSATGWRCSTCGELITSIGDGCVEWLAGEDEHGTTRLKGLRLVHQLAASPRTGEAHGCQYDAFREFHNDHSVVESLSLERFVGPDGLMLLLSFIALGEMPTDDILELAKRVQIPGYEQVRELFQAAIDSGVVSPVIGARFYMQSEIRELLRWADNPLRSPRKPAA